MSDQTVVFIASDCLGEGDDELGRALMLSGIAALAKLEPPPAAVLLMNAGVKLCGPESPAVRDLRALAARGADVACCGTCLDWFGMRETLAAGRASNMAEILALQSGASRVIRL